MGWIICIFVMKPMTSPPPSFFYYYIFGQKGTTKIYRLYLFTLQIPNQQWRLLLWSATFSVTLFCTKLFWCILTGVAIYFFIFLFFHASEIGEGGTEPRNLSAYINALQVLYHRSTNLRIGKGYKL